MTMLWVTPDEMLSAQSGSAFCHCSRNCLTSPSRTVSLQCSHTVNVNTVLSWKIKGTCLDPALPRQKQCASVCTQLPGAVTSSLCHGVKAPVLMTRTCPLWYPPLLCVWPKHGRKKTCWFVKNILLNKSLLSLIYVLFIETTYQK